MLILKGVTGDFIGHSAQVFILKGVKWGREAVERWKARREFDSMYTKQSITKCRYCQYQFTNVLKIKDLEQERSGEEGEKKRGKAKLETRKQKLEMGEKKKQIPPPRRFGMTSVG